MPRCAFLTTEGLDLDYVYDDLAVAPLAARGWAVEFVPWRAAVDWSAFDVVVIRSPWDYMHAPDAFLAVLAEIDAATRLENPLGVCRWNADKRYLRDLAAAGVPVVPTAWEDGLSEARLAGLLAGWGARGGVVKPTVGGGARDTFWLRPGDRLGPALAAFADGRAAMAQPFVPSVVDEGEFSVFAFGGALSHTILKTPKGGDFRVQEEFGSRLVPVEPEPALRAITDAALAAVPSPEPLLYARVDAVRMPDGGFAIIELELIEPSLYFPFAPGAAERFADAVAALG
ncbi:ATP-grasp domain-containing protein [Rubrivirga sp. IMCC43871]|uniref:ATP-grasp domain-containing protein n=1 Tax=Rubrivirga sp. IMCC43871 TaxID=3391575 RepID=UPI0039901C2E